MSSPEGVTTACGLPAQHILNSTAVRVEGAKPLEAMKRDNTLGYRGFIPGIRAETVFGASKTHANVIAHQIRPGAGPDLSGKDPYFWNCPPDEPYGRRSQASCQEWSKVQQACPPVLNGGTQVRHFGKAIQGFS